MSLSILMKSRNFTPICGGFASDIMANPSSYVRKDPYLISGLLRVDIEVDDVDTMANSGFWFGFALVREGFIKKKSDKSESDS